MNYYCNPIPHFLSCVFVCQKKGFKGTIPSAILNNCLKDMALDSFNPKSQFTDSDDKDEDNTRQTKKKDKIGSSGDK